LTLITLAVAPFILVVTAAGVAIDASMEGRILPIYSRAGQLAEEVFSSIATVHAFWAGSKLSRKYEKLLSEAKAQGMKKSLNMSISFSGEYFGIFSGYALAFFQGIRMYANGEITESGDIVT